MIAKTPLILSAAALLALTACVDPNQYPDDPNARAKGGAIAGAVIGGILGPQTGEGDDLSRAVIGAGIGAAVGGAIGASLDRQAAELRAQIQTPGVSVTNMGDYLVVNMPEGLLFATDSATLRPTLVGDLNRVAASLLRYPDSRIEVVGHTDNVGTAAYNMDLSQRRAVAVASVLQGAGVPWARMQAIGRGFDQPVASNATEAGRAQNRRVEILIRPTR
jgi:outer membrane protein OmpA-like peptidoglycan-associated protein